MVWVNDDGLRVKFGTEEGVAGKAGAYSVDGPVHVAEVDVTLTELTSSSAVLDHNMRIPAGAFIEKVEVVVKTAATSGGSATLNVGLALPDGSTYDADGLIAAGALATINATGNVVEYTQGSTGHGALVGSELASIGLLVANYGTAAFTAGVIKVRVFYSF